MYSTCDECGRIRALIEQLGAIESDLARVDPEHKETAIEQMANLKGQLLDVLCDALSSGDGPIRRAAAYGLSCLLYTSDAADDLLCVDLGGRRFIKKKTK